MSLFQLAKLFKKKKKNEHLINMQCPRCNGVFFYINEQNAPPYHEDLTFYSVLTCAKCSLRVEMREKWYFPNERRYDELAKTKKSYHI